MGAPSHNFNFLPEYAYSAAILKVDLTAIGNTTYDLPTLADDHLPNLTGPFGGDFGRRQAKIVAGGPVQVYAPGFRNPYDVVITRAGKMYTVDNGANAGWGDIPDRQRSRWDVHQRNTRARCQRPGRAPSHHRCGLLRRSSEPDVRQQGKHLRQPGAIASPDRESGGVQLLETRNVRQPRSDDVQRFHQRHCRVHGRQLRRGARRPSSVGQLQRQHCRRQSRLNGAVLSNQTLLSNVSTHPLSLATQGDTGAFPRRALRRRQLNRVHRCFPSPPTSAAAPTPATGLSGAADDDGDGYVTTDEIANHTNPCSAGSVPNDWSRNGKSDLIDPDDDAVAGRADTAGRHEGSFGIDPHSGKTMTIPFVYTWDNGEQPTQCASTPFPSGCPGGLLNMGFTGLMTDKHTDYRNLYDTSNMILGGAAGVLTLAKVPSGDALGAANTQQYAFQLGVNTSGVGVFTVHTRLISPFAGTTPSGNQSFGLQFGTGDQDNYFKLVATANGGSPGIQAVAEVGGVPSARGGECRRHAVRHSVVHRPLPHVDPATGTVQPSYRLVDAGGVAGPLTQVASPRTIPTSWFTDANLGVALGIIATSSGGPTYSATWKGMDTFLGSPAEPSPSVAAWGLGMNVTIAVPRRRLIARGRRGVVCVAVASLLVAVTISQLADVATRAPGAAPPPTATTADAATGSLSALPMAWVANTGQTDAAVRYLARGLGYATFLTDTEAVVRLDDAVVRLGFDGASSTPTLRTGEPLAATVSSFTGSDRSAWQSAAPAAKVVRYENLWPGIDATFRGSGTHLEWDYHVAPGADPSMAGTTVAGFDRIAVDGDRATLASADAEGGELTLTIPAVWQTQRDGTRVDRDASWVLDGDTLRFVPENWDPSLPGVIDPTLDWSTYLGGGPGGGGFDQGIAIAIDGAGNAFVTGTTRSSDFPTTSGSVDNDLEGALDGTPSSPRSTPPVVRSCSAPSWADPVTTKALDIAVDANRQRVRRYVHLRRCHGLSDHRGSLRHHPERFLGRGGHKAGPDRRVSSVQHVLGGAASGPRGRHRRRRCGQRLRHGAGSGCWHRLPDHAGGLRHHPQRRKRMRSSRSSTPPAACWSSAPCWAAAAATRRTIWRSTAPVAPTITGSTSDAAIDYPTTPGGVRHHPQRHLRRVRHQTGRLWQHPRVQHPDRRRTRRLRSRVALDAAGDAYVTGATYNPFGGAAFPTTPGAYDTSQNGSSDVFVTELDPTGSSLVFSTFLGGSIEDSGQGIALDPTGNVYVTGDTRDGAIDLPTTPGAYDTVPNGIVDGFVTKLDPTGSTLDYSTRIGGGANDVGNGIAVDAAGIAYITGGTFSSDYPTTAGAYDTTHNGRNDVFVTKLDAVGSSLVYSTLLGGSDGSGSDGITGIAADASGVYVTGTTASNYFPTTTGAFDTVRTATPTSSWPSSTHRAPA